VEAEQERRDQRAQAKAQRQAHLAELAKQGCGCASEAECRLVAVDWWTLGKKARKAFEEQSAACMKMQRRQAEAKQRRQEHEQQRQEQRAAQRRELEEFQERLRQIGRFDPMPSLMYLRDVVLKERHDRCPKWRFRLAPDLVVQLQPRPAERRDRYQLFEGIVIEDDAIEKRHFGTVTSRASFMFLDFGIRSSEHDKVDPTPGQWHTVVWRSHGVRSAIEVLLGRLVAGLCSLDRLDAHTLFEPACLICGKGLTDPASMARGIGPECAGTSSLDVGFLKVATAA
jgi:hypothetical protein